MQLWMRRAAVLVAAAAGSAGLMMPSANAQVPSDFPEFPEFPEFSEFFESFFPSTSVPSPGPPPTMPLPTTSSPPPTMPPPSPTTSSPPPTMPPPTIDFDDTVEPFLENLIDRLEQGGDQFAGVVDDLRGIIDSF